MIWAIIMAAGKGTRMKTEIPKCAYPLIKKPLINYILDSVAKTKIDKKIVVLGHKKETFEGLLEDVEVAYQAEQLGTAHAVMMALPFLDDEGISLILPGDAPLIDSELLDYLISEHRDALTVATASMDDPTGYGRIIKNNGLIERIVEEKEASEEEKKIKEINTGIMVVNNKDLKEALLKVNNHNQKQEYYLTDIVEILKPKGVHACQLTDSNKVMGINDLWALSKAEKYLLDLKRRELLLEGVNLVNPETITIGPDVIVEGGATIYPGCFLTGKTVVHAGAIIGPNSELHNAIIEEGAICRHSVVFDSMISKGATVGPFAHLRMNSVVGPNDRIGNFVEMKNAILGEKTNAAHLSYIGDASIGNRVNFGCGSITVNYDGKKKHRTTVEDDVFIGCNSNLIAPITIGQNAFIAAGSTIDKDVPSMALAIARNKQTNKEDYAHKYKK